MRKAYFLASDGRIELGDGKILDLGRRHPDYPYSVTQGSWNRAEIEILAKSLVARYPQSKGRLCLIAAPFMLAPFAAWENICEF
jgi:hypothetical protein